MNYIDYDDIGVVAIRCMSCGCVIVQRSYIELAINSIPPRKEKVLTLKKFNTFRRKRFDLVDGGYVEAMVCKSCVDLDIDPKVIEKAVRDGWKATWKREGKGDREIEKRVKQLSKIKKHRKVSKPKKEKK